MSGRSTEKRRLSPGRMVSFSPTSLSLRLQELDHPHPPTTHGDSTSEPRPCRNERAALPIPGSQRRILYPWIRLDLPRLPQCVVTKYFDRVSIRRVAEVRQSWRPPPWVSGRTAVALRHHQSTTAPSPLSSGRLEPPCPGSCRARHCGEPMRPARVRRARPSAIQKDLLGLVDPRSLWTCSYAER
jgi:hypothetical protein